MEIIQPGQDPKEQSQRLQQLFGEVVSTAIDDLIVDSKNKKICPNNRAIRRRVDLYFNSADGVEVLSLAGINHSVTVVDKIYQLVLSGRPMSSVMGLNFVKTRKPASSRK